MGRYLDILRRAEAKPGCDKSDKSDKSHPFGRLYRFGRTFQELERRCPAYIEPADWQQAIEDGRRFLSTWGEKAEALGWTARELFGVHPVPEQRAESYHCRTGLVWLLNGHPVVALTAETAAIQTTSGGMLTYRKYNKPTFGPFADSLGDFDGAA